jgi:peptidoglycan/xylan/chitin deacetylase (PgdA/CDA1 family)
MQSVDITWPAGAHAALTLSFDDGYAATYEATVARLQTRDLCATYSVITNSVGSVFEGLPTATWQQWQKAARMGHEIASHSATHNPLAGSASDLRRLLQGLRAAPDRLAYVGRVVLTARVLFKQHRAPHSPARRSSFPSVADLAASRLTIDRIVGGLPVESFVYPGGRHSAASQRAVVDAGFKSARTADLGLNYPSCDFSRLRAVTLGPGLTVDNLAVWLERARANRAWLIIGLHLVAERNPTSYPYFCPLSEFQRLLDALQSQPFWIETQRQVVRYLMGQNLSGRMG